MARASGFRALVRSRVGVDGLPLPGGVTFAPRSQLGFRPHEGAAEPLGLGEASLLAVAGVVVQRSCADAEQRGGFTTRHVPLHKPNRIGASLTQLSWVKLAVLAQEASMKPRRQTSTYLWSRFTMSAIQNSREELAPLHPDADGFTLFRILPSGEGRAYTGVEFTDGWKGANRFLRRLRAFGYVRNSSAAPDGYHVLDVLNANGDIVQDYAVPPHPSRAFEYIKRKLQLRVVTPDVAAPAAGKSPAVAS